MIDFLEFRIPFFPKLYDIGLESSRAVDLAQVCSPDNIPLSATSVSIDSNGFAHCDTLRHPYESLKSSWSGMAFKINPKGYGKFDKPHVLIKGSPAKILQGQNVYGTLDYGLCLREMFSILASIYPNLYSMLDIRSSELRAIDITFFARSENDFIAKQTIQALGRITNRHIRAAREQYKTTCYWNRESTYYRNKAYLKEYELLKEINDLKKQLKPSTSLEQKDKINKKLSILNHALEFTKNMVRFESRIFARRLEDWGFPTNAFEFDQSIKDDYKKYLTNMWNLSFKSIFEALEGQTMDIMNDETIQNRIKLKFEKTRTQNKIFNFYLQIRSLGYQRVKDITPRTTFFRNEKDLISCGISKVNLQSMETEKTNIVPLIRFIDIKFEDQHPAGYIEPRSQFETKLYAVG